MPGLFFQFKIYTWLCAQVLKPCALPVRTSTSPYKGVNPDRKSGAVPLRRLGGELHRLSGSTYGRAVDKTLRSTSLLSIAAWRKGGSWRLGNPWSPHSLLRIQ